VLYVAPISLAQFGLLAAMAASILVVMELFKRILHHQERRSVPVRART
jgi:hypothetical protein